LNFHNRFHLLVYQVLFYKNLFNAEPHQIRTLIFHKIFKLLRFTQLKIIFLPKHLRVINFFIECPLIDLLIFDFRFSKLTLLYCPFFHKNCSPNCEWFHFSSFPWLHTPTFMISMIVEIFPMLVQVLLFCWFFPKVLFRFVLEVSLFVRDPLVCLLCLCYSQPERFIWYFF